MAYKSRIPRIAAALPAKANAIERATAQAIAASAKQHAPVGATGELRDSIEARENGVYAAWYWFFNEFGTARQAPHPFIMPAVEEHTATAMTIGRTILGGL